MDFLGMGTLEVLLVLLVAFIFLGPERMVDAGRMLGKIVREVRRMSADLRVSIEESDVSPPEASGPRRNAAGSAPEATGYSEGPVSFRPPQAGDARPPGQEEP